VVGVGYWHEATCGRTVDAIADSIDYIARLVGDAHVALGSDWDGCVAVPPGLDAAGVAQVTHALRARGYEGAPLARIMGGNALRVLRAGLLPGGSAAAGGAAAAAAGRAGG
jgi:microsomal dipeptidase-like Zn-dependent dipeptidase